MSDAFASSGTGRITSRARLCSSISTTTGSYVANSASLYEEYAQMIITSPIAALRAAAPFRDISPDPRRPLIA